MRAILSEIKFLEQFVTCVKSMNNIRFLDNSRNHISKIKHKRTHVNWVKLDYYLTQNMLAAKNKMLDIKSIISWY